MPKFRKVRVTRIWGTAQIPQCARISAIGHSVNGLGAVVSIHPCRYRFTRSHSFAAFAVPWPVPAVSAKNASSTAWRDMLGPTDRACWNKQVGYSRAVGA